MPNTQQEINVFAKTNFRNKEVPFGIKSDDRRRHMYIIGKTGMGKTTLMENMVIQDIRNGHGVAFLDPHGDSVQRILDSVPSSRVNDVIYFNPADMEHPIAFNILEAVDSKYKHLVASGLMGVFTKIWANLWSARMEYILNNTILALLDSPGNTLLGITRMYVDKKYRKKIVDNIKDPMVRAFWVEEFANYNEKYRTEAIAPIQNKVGQFLSSGIIRNIVGQSRSTIDLREIMDNQKILIMDLSKGRVGEDNSALLGAMLVTKLQLAAMSRTDIPEEDRKDFYLYVDEFQNFATESFATILSEARKYRLCLIVGHQYIAQLEQDKNTKVRDAIFGNVGTMVIFRIGAADAEFLETEFEPVFIPNDLVNLPKYNIILKLMINGATSEPFSAVSIPPSPDYFTANAEKVIKVSRERYANPVLEVEEKISRWMGQDFEAGAEASEGEKVQKINSTQIPKKDSIIQTPSFKLSTSPKQENEAKPALAALKLEIANTATEIEVKNTVVRQEIERNEEVHRPEPKPFVIPQIKIQQPSHARPVSTGGPDNERRHSSGHSGDRRHSSGPGRNHAPSSSHSRSSSHGRPQSHPNPHTRPEPKKHNPIWDTVANLHQEKVKIQEKEIGHALTATPKPVPAPKSSPSKQDPEIDTERTVLKPGQSHIF